jgi:hypothetical protein
MTTRNQGLRLQSRYVLRSAAANLTGLGVGLICGLLPTSVLAGVTFVSSDATAVAIAEMRDGNRFSNQKSDDIVFAPQDHSAEASALLHNGPVDQSSTHATSSVAFTDATAGTIALAGRAIMDSETRPDSRFVLNEWVLQYAYDFTIDQAEPFTFDYSVLNSAPPLDPSDGFVEFEPYQFKLTNLASGVVATASFLSGDNGRIALPLGFDPSAANSGDYHLEISSFSKGFLGTQASATFDSTGNFAFKIGALDIPAASVPEPSSWVMTIVGLGAAGSMIRRRQRLARSIARA